MSLAWENPPTLVDFVPLALCWECREVTNPHSRTGRCMWCDGEPRKMRENVFAGSAIKRFFTHVTLGIEEEDCWLWTASTNSGAPQFYVSEKVRGRMVYGSRFAYMLFHDDADDHRLQRTCVEEKCVHPDHFKAVRIPKGEKGLSQEHEQMLSGLMEAVSIIQERQNTLDRQVKALYMALRNEVRHISSQG